MFSWVAASLWIENFWRHPHGVVLVHPNQLGCWINATQQIDPGEKTTRWIHHHHSSCWLWKNGGDKSQDIEHYRSMRPGQDRTSANSFLCMLLTSQTTRTPRPIFSPLPASLFKWGCCCSLDLGRGTCRVHTRTAYATVLENYTKCRSSLRFTSPTLFFRAHGQNICAWTKFCHDAKWDIFELFFSTLCYAAENMEE